MATLVALLLFSYLQFQAPKYSGRLHLPGLKKDVTVRYDEYGIPHIYASNEADAYFALGYAHAQERLFQMEMLRRVASGRLAEILGEEFVETDKLFRTLGIEKKASELAEKFMDTPAAHKAAALSYFAGINSFIENGNTPVEFTLMGIPKRPFEIIDAYRATGFVALGFAEGFKVDPITAKIHALYGVDYLRDLGVHSINDSTYIPNYNPNSHLSLAKILNKSPIPPIIGSNSWIVSGSKSASGGPIFENDTHIGFSQPAVWFEAHLDYPGHSFYGHYLGAVPFGLLGHNDFSALGLTMFENDDVDFFQEMLSEADSTQYRFKDTTLAIASRVEEIRIKDKEPVQFTIRETHHGPIINEFYLDSGVTDKPVSVWWAFQNVEQDFLNAIYNLNHSKSLTQTREAVATIEAPGLNVMYADRDGNIAWWAAAKLPMRADHVDSKLLLDGTGADEYLGFYTFDENPQAVNPPWNYVYSANNQPDSVNGTLYPGYYMPMDRGRQIVNTLKDSEKWSFENSKNLSLDVTSPTLPVLTKTMVEISRDVVDLENSALSSLVNWDGSCTPESIEPSIFYTYLTWLVYYAMSDELGYEDWQSFATSSLMKRSYNLLLGNKESKWWDDVSTDAIESRDEIVKKAFEKTLATLNSTMKSSNPEDWLWSKVHQLSHNHPLGMVTILKPFFTVGPFEIGGGNETLNNQMFNLDTAGVFQVKGGPSMRTIIDLTDMNSAISISPTGQSGNIMSRHYKDQAEMFVKGQFRNQLIDSMQVVKNTKSILTLKPRLND